MTAKEIFLKSPHREPHEKWTMSADAEAARDAAMLEFVAQQPRGTNVSEAWDLHCQLIGAKRYAEILFSIHLRDETPKPTKLATLRPPS